MAISDLFAVFRELFVLGRRGAYVARIYRARIDAADSAAKVHYLMSMPRYVIEAALIVGVALFVIGQALSGDVIKSAGTIGVFLSGGFRLTAALLPLQNALLSIKAAIPSALTAQEILEQVQSAGKSYNHESQLSKRNLHQSGPVGVELRDISFRYKDSDTHTLSNVNIKVEPGSQVALMGPSGAGKSTLADLLCGVLEPDSGSIVLSEKIGYAPTTQIQGRVGYVPQHPGLVSGTILENVALSENPEDVDRHRVIEALELSNLYTFVKNLPMGLDTPLGKLQDGLSGGQAQRLGIARALYTNPGLLVMDEATSALDAESEAEIQRALVQMRGKVTVVLIAHRLNTIQHADKIVLIEKGQVKDQGTFRELTNRNSSVQKIVELMRVDGYDK
jgi:ATP-binding cassette subfamily C protein